MALFIVDALLAAALAAASPALPQEPLQAATAPPAPAAPPENDVVVTGTPGPERDRAIRDFVGALTNVPITGQISRLEDAICPSAMGFTGTARAAVEARMRAVAAEAGLRVGAAGCRPNILLMVTRDKKELIRQLASRYPHSFGIDPHNSPRNIAAQPGPSSAWHANATLNADGRALSMNEGAFINRTGRSATRISAGGRPTFIAAAVVIEQHALEGLSVTQIADYALMRALARIDPSRLPPDPTRSILTALEAPMGTEVPVTLTRWDMGFLRGLYASTANLRAAQQRGEIQHQVARELDRPEGRRN